MSASLKFGALDAHWLDLRRHYGAVRQSIASRALRPFAYLEISPKPSMISATATADHILKNGWSLPGGKIASVCPPLKWSGHSRSFEFHLHAWMPIQRLLTAFDASRSWEYFDAAVAMAEDWMSSCAIDFSTDSIECLAEHTIREAEGSWWYDMAVAQRLHRLSYIADVCARVDGISDVRLNRMFDHLILHNIVLCSEEVYRPTTNHGFFQALNQFAAMRRLPPQLDCDGQFLSLSRQRLREMVSKQYSASMVHLEHSPGYHYMVTVALMNALRAGILDPELVSLLHEAERNLGWMVTPTGNLACFGDTDPRSLFLDSEVDFFDEPTLRATLRQSKETPVGVKAFLDAGYAFARLYPLNVKESTENTSYLAQTACFHSRVHKHADHLSFVWHERGHSILVDPARYAYSERTEVGSALNKQGFWYSDPKRIYCETTKAHNTVEIDSQSFPRTKVTPWGSALVYAGQQRELVVTECFATHFRAIRHRRYLIMRPGHFLLVLDWLYDRSGTPHDYRQWFHFDSPWELVDEGAHVRAGHSGAPFEICVASLVAAPSLGAIVRGQETPELLGWQSDRQNSLIPSSCLQFHANSNKPVIFATLFAITNTLHFDQCYTIINSSMKAGKIRWDDDAGSNCVTIGQQSTGHVIAEWSADANLD